jgi:hypothetical protein
MLNGMVVTCSKNAQRFEGLEELEDTSVSITCVSAETKISYPQDTIRTIAVRFVRLLDNLTVT